MTLESTFSRDRPRFIKAVAAEAIGTSFLALAVLNAPPGLAFAAAGLVLLALVVVIGDVSGAHINPAVRLGLVVARKFSVVDGAGYVVAQLAGALTAVVLMIALGRSLPDIRAGGGAFVFEFLGAFLLVATVVHVTVKGVPEVGSALAIGAALAVGVLIAAGASGGILNPALSFAFLLTGVIEADLLLAWLPYLVAPLAAGALAAVAGTFLGSGQKPQA